MPSVSILQDVPKAAQQLLCHRPWQHELKPSVGFVTSEHDRDATDRHSFWCAAWTNSHTEGIRKLDDAFAVEVMQLQYDLRYHKSMSHVCL